VNKLLSLSLIPLAATATVASIAFTPDSAQAIGIGSVAISGTNVWGNSNTLATFNSVTVGTADVSATGVFNGLEGSSVTVKSIAFSPIVGNQATYNGIAEFLIFNNGIKFDLAAGTAEFFNSSLGLAFETNFTGKFRNDFGKTLGRGNFAILNSGQSTTLALSAQAVPEPLTILGTGLALGLGGLFKSKQSKKQSLDA